MQSSTPSRAVRPRLLAASLPLFSNPQAVFLGLASATIIVFLVLCPVATGPDEVNHIYRVARIFSGGILPQQYGEAEGMPLWGGDVPRQLFDALSQIPHLPNTALVADFWQPLRSQGTTIPVNIPNTEVYSPLPYLPALLGYALAYATNMPVFWAIVLMRLLSASAYVLGIMGLIRLTQHVGLRWLLVVIGLMPVNLYQAAVVTADTLTTVTVVAFSLGIAHGALLRRRNSPGLQTVVLITALALPLVKPTYVILVPLIFLLPSLRLWAKTAVMVGAAVLFAFWYRLSSGAGYGMGWMREPVDRHQILPTEQLAGVLHDPLLFVNTTIRTFVMFGNEIFAQTFGQMGYFHGGTLSSFMLTPLLSLAALALVTGAFQTTRRFGAGHWFTLLIVAASMAAILGTVYLNFTVLGRLYIEGVQGRYFAPFFLLLFVVLAAIPLRIAKPSATPGLDGSTAPTMIGSVYGPANPTWTLMITLCCAVSILAAILTYVIRVRYGY